MMINWNDLQELLYIIGYWDFLATCLTFILSFFVNNSSIYDPYWSVAPIFIVIYEFWSLKCVSGNIFRKISILLLVIVWGCRLTYNMLRGTSSGGHLGSGVLQEDWRYLKIRKQTGIFYWPVSFLGIHLVPTILVYLGCTSVTVGMMSSEADFSWLDLVAIIFSITAIWMEATADAQLHHFTSSVKKKNPEKVLNSGLWGISRHPNYLGEVLFWWGMYLFSISSTPLSQQYKWTIIGPISITLLFFFISIPLIEGRMRSRSEYQKYITQVPMLIPWKFFIGKIGFQ